MHQAQWPGIDFLTEGRQPLGPGTISEDGVYVLDQDRPIAQAPPLMLLELEPKPESHQRIASDREYEDDLPEDIAQFEAYLYKAPPAISKQHGNDQTYMVACKGRDYGLSLERVYECMIEKYNHKCQPPWKLHEIQAIIDHAFMYARSAPGVKSKAFDPELQKAMSQRVTVMKSDKQPDRQPDQRTTGEKVADLRYSHMRQGFLLDDKGALLKGNRVNARLLLHHDTRFKDLFYWDEFANEARFNRVPWWHPSKMLPSGVTDDDIRQVLDWFASKEYPIEDSLAWFAVDQLAFQHAKHPVKEYLERTEWDRKPRLNRLLIDTCGAADTPYIQWVSKNLGISAVARIYQPGCLVKNVMILESREQNRKKSMWIDCLAHPWSSTGHIDPGNKDTYLNLAGYWIVELPEINQTLGKRDVNACKAIVSTRADVFRAPYDRKSRKVPRQSIWLGSINPTATGYLIDETGDSRYWPVKIDYCDTDALNEIRDQVWAEALYRYRQGEIWWLTREQEEVAKFEQDSRKRFDPWVSMLRSALNGNGSEETLETWKVFKMLGLDSNRVTPREYERLGVTMVTLGYYMIDGDRWAKR